MAQHSDSDLLGGADISTALGLNLKNMTMKKNFSLLDQNKYKNMDKNVVEESK